ncbi:MAG: hypothetical protein SCM11_01490 [Bacillota bacterium]|nr:hypothetical protein [Bacillota bacterium]
MKADLVNYDVQPCIVLGGRTERITLKPRGQHANFDDHSEYTIEIVPMETSPMKRLLLDRNAVFNTTMTYQPDRITARPVKGCLYFTYCFEAEQQYVLDIWSSQEPNKKQQFRLYALHPDLYALRPFKGDLHIHSNRSDGRQEPGIVAANFRRAGFDFIAITDHSKYQPSLEAMERFADVPTGLAMFPGEEIHIGGYMHAVNVGGRFSVNERYFSDEHKFQAQIDRIARTTSLPEGINPLEFALRKWVSDRIREGGGLSVIVHPHWIHPYLYNYNMQDTMTDFLFENNIYDAFEVCSRYARMNLQVAFYNDQRAKGRKIPIVGASDTHDSEADRQDAAYTLAFAADCTFPSIYKAVMSLYSVAVQPITDSTYFICGPYRMVKYGSFLLEQFYPRHDDLCLELGIQMKNHVLGDHGALSILQQTHGMVERYSHQCFSTFTGGSA